MSLRRFVNDGNCGTVLVGCVGRSDCVFFVSELLALV